MLFWFGIFDFFIKKDSYRTRNKLLSMIRVTDEILETKDQQDCNVIQTQIRAACKVSTRKLFVGATPIRQLER